MYYLRTSSWDGSTGTDTPLRGGTKAARRAYERALRDIEISMVRIYRDHEFCFGVYKRATAAEALATLRGRTDDFPGPTNGYSQFSETLYDGRTITLRLRYGRRTWLLDGKRVALSTLENLE